MNVLLVSPRTPMTFWSAKHAVRFVSRRAAFPPLLPGKPPLMPDDRLLDVVRAVQRVRGRPLPETLPGAFADAEPFLTVLPELDHYHRVRQQGHLGPMVELLPPQPWPEEPRFFAYLKATNPATPIILAALAQSGFAGQAYVLGADAQRRQELSRPGLEILDAPPSLNELPVMLPTVSQPFGPLLSVRLNCQFVANAWFAAWDHVEFES